MKNSKIYKDIISKNIMVDVTLLRTLTEKSQLKFGKYADSTVKEVINSRHLGYLRWCYFNCSKISFIEDILEELKISENYRIEKPGKNLELGEKLDEEIWERMSGLIRHINEGVGKKEQKRKLARHNKRDSLKYTKSVMQRINHGHR